MAMEDLINECGGFGRYQVLIILGIDIHILSLGWSMLQMSFAGFIPDWYCVLGSDRANSSYYTNHSLYQCSINNSHTGYQEQDCTSHHFEGDSVTAVTEWDLVCDRKWIPAAITSIQMTGVLVGSVISGQLSDLFGRKKVTFGFSLLHTLLNIGIAFSTSWKVYAMFIFFIGIGAGATLVVAFPYPMEFLPTRWRPVLAVLPVWQMSVYLFSLAAYLTGNWACINIACGVLGLAGVFTYCYVPESLRWLTLKGHFKEAERVLEKMAKVNGKSTPKSMRAVLEEVYKMEKECRLKGRKYSYWHLFQSKRHAMITLIFSYCWFTLSIVFYGISFGVSSLSGNLHLNIFLLSVIGLPLTFTSFYFTNRFGRKWTCVAMLVFAVVPMTGCLIVNDVMSADRRGPWVTGLSLVSKMGLEAAWTVSCTWVSESYPTVIRSLGFGVVNAAARVGGILSPFVIDLNDRPFMTYAIISCMLLVAAILSSFLPDTKGRLLADSLHEKKVPSSIVLNVSVVGQSDGDGIVQTYNGFPQPGTRIQGTSSFEKENGASRQNNVDTRCESRTEQKDFRSTRDSNGIDVHRF